MRDSSEEQTDYLQEIYRVKWLRARSRLDRWKEEVMYLNSEMSWYFGWEKDSKGKTKKFKGNKMNSSADSDVDTDAEIEDDPANLETLTMVFSRDLFPILTRLEPVEMQSVVNYASSRTRGAGNALAMHLSAMKNADHSLFILALGREVSAASALLGLATTLYDDYQIFPPPSLRGLTPLIVQNRLTDWSAVNVAVSRERSAGDDLLVSYENCWWHPFDDKADLDTFRQSPLDIVHAWTIQRRHLPAHTRIPRGLINFQGLSDEELDKAWAISCDSLKMIDKDLEADEKTIADVTLLLVKSQASMRDLEAAEKEAVKEIDSAIDQMVV
ncbi:hypothetical protein NMY22_g12874 [Coprinellus aureogranulatus]|nr:hypothetical protein NMY22_g12874 [Coprinellus aureogranulatus]